MKQDYLKNVIASLNFLSVGIYNPRFQIEDRDIHSILKACVEILEEMPNVHSENERLNRRISELHSILAKKEQDILDANSRYANALNGLKC